LPVPLLAFDQNRARHGRDLLDLHEHFDRDRFGSPMSPVTRDSSCRSTSCLIAPTTSSRTTGFEKTSTKPAARRRSSMRRIADVGEANHRDRRPTTARARAGYCARSSRPAGHLPRPTASSASVPRGSRRAATPSPSGAPPVREACPGGTAGSTSVSVIKTDKVRAQKLRGTDVR
jgi:hypothetical protein